MYYKLYDIQGRLYIFFSKQIPERIKYPNHINRYENPMIRVKTNERIYKWKRWKYLGYSISFPLDEYYKHEEQHYGSTEWWEVNPYIDENIRKFHPKDEKDWVGEYTPQIIRTTGIIPIVDIKHNYRGRDFYEI